jgi:ribosome modulation factor
MSRQNQDPYKQHRAEGAQAKPGSLCPYGKAEIGARCAWLAGHIDTHGKSAWEIARGTTPL